MTTLTDRFVSRRTALTGLGVGTLGLALATPRSILAQDATPTVPIATHPIVGAWRITSYPGTVDEGHSIGIFAETGLYAEVIWDRNVSLGEWRPLDEDTVELTTFTKWLIPFDAYFVPSGENVDVRDVILTSEMGTARVPVRIDLDDTGATFSSNGMVWLYNDAGANLNSFAIDAIGERMTVAVPAATPTS